MRRVSTTPKLWERGIAQALDAAGISRDACARWLGLHKSSLSKLLTDCEPHGETWERRLSRRQVGIVLANLPESAAALVVQVAVLDGLGYRAGVDGDAVSVGACLRTEGDALIDRSVEAHQILRDGEIDDSEREKALELAGHLEEHARVIRSVALGGE